MAKIIFFDKYNKRRKKWEHFKLKSRVYLFRLSYLLNLITILYFMKESGQLTNIIETIEKVAPILGSLIN